MTQTVNLALELPNFDVSPWHDDVNNNFKIIDAIINSHIDGRNLTGIWQNATGYTNDEVLVDPDSGGLWKCAVPHTSASTGSFEDDRIANPTYWVLATTDIRAAGTWATSTAYAVGDVVVSGYITAICSSAHTSSSSFASDSAYWQYIVDLTSTVSTISTSETNAANSASAASSSAAAAAASAALLADFAHVGAWAITTAYNTYEIVNVTSGTYQGWSFMCNTDHTSDGTSFDNDYALGYWDVIAQRGAAGAGTGDLLSTNNLSDVASAATSRTNLGAAASGANSDITSLTGLTTDLAVAHGGTGASTAAAARVNLDLEYGVDIPALGTVGTFTAQQYFGTQTIADAGTINWNLNTQQVATVSLGTGGGAARTLANPTNIKDGGTYILRIVQPASGTLHTISFGSNYKWLGGNAPELTQSYNAVDLFCFIAIGGNMYGSVMKGMA